MFVWFVQLLFVRVAASLKHAQATKAPESRSDLQNEENSQSSNVINHLMIGRARFGQPVSARAAATRFGTTASLSAQ